MRVCVQVFGSVPRKKSVGPGEVGWGQEGRIKQSPVGDFGSAPQGNPINSVGLTLELMGGDSLYCHSLIKECSRGM